jgi:RNA polymerase sigma factor (sigma-70 family)
MTRQTDSRDGDLASRNGAAGRDFESFFRRVYPKAVAVAERVTGELAAAEDAAIEAMAKAHFRWKRIGPQTWREAWVLKVAVNEAISRLPKPFIPPVPVEAGDPADGVALRHTLNAAVRALPRRQREVVRLRYLVGLTETEIAEALNLSLGTVRTHLRRGVAALRSSVGRDLKEEHLAQLS